MLINITTTRRGGALELVDLLLECHARIRHFVSLAHAAGARSDASDQGRIDACLQVEKYFTQALPLHLADEEQSILPRLRSCCSAEVSGALETMESQHSMHEAKTKALLSASVAVRLSPQNLNLRAALTQAALELERDFSEHLQLEESIIFPAIRACVPKDVQEHIVREIRQRRAFPDARVQQ